MYVLEKLDGEILKELGANLRKLRKNKKLSQEGLASRIGVSRKHISEIESGKGTTLLVFIKLLKEFNKSNKLLELTSVSDISPKAMFKNTIK